MPLLLGNFKFLWTFVVLDCDIFNLELLLFWKWFFLTFRVYSGTVVTSNLLALQKYLQNENFQAEKVFHKTFHENENFLVREISCENFQIFAKFVLFTKMK